ncbi:MAG: hypothetical protein L3J39_09265 [Verrucomicrobiales bacterium]|nr:hypothetical protein [Verrucomicrobiales bacterium]
MKPLTTTIIIVLLAAQLSGCGQNAINSADFDYESISVVKEEQSGVKSRWHGKGKVIIGRLDMPNNAKIATRTPIYNDGSFCTALYSERKLIFYAHGYEPLWVHKSLTSPVSDKMAGNGSEARS